MHGWTFHGGRLSEARRAYPDAPGPWLDLSTGINPHAWPGAAGLEVDWRALPDGEALAELEHAAAEYFGTSPERVCALPGTEIGLRLLDDLGLPRPTVHLAPGYRTHAEAFAGSAAIDRRGLAEAAGTGGTVLLANPNNPDGHIFAVEELLRLARGSNGWLVVDEAFADPSPAASLIPYLDPAACVLVLRSFGKFFGLAGVRLGFAVGPELLITALRRKLGSWPVSSAAIQIGLDAYRDTAWIAAMRDKLAADATALDAVLVRHGFEPRGGCPLFRLAKATDAAALFDRLARRGILTRPFDYAPSRLRFGLPGSAGALARLDQALADG